MDQKRNLGIAGTVTAAIIVLAAIVSASPPVALQPGGEVTVSCAKTPALYWTNSGHTSVKVVCPTPVPTPSPIASPISTPSPTPTSSPSPTPSPTPVPTPTTSLPNVIEFTGTPSTTTDQSSAIKNFLDNNVGKTVGFKAGAVYRVDARILLNNWSGTIVGRGATFKRITTASGLDAIVRFVQGHDISINDLNIIGPATAANVTNWTSWAREEEHALYIDSGARITVNGGSFSNTWGDGIYLAARDNCTGSFCGFPDTITLNGFNALTNGRNSVSITDGKNITLSNCHSDLSGLAGLDNEPNAAGDTIANITIKGCDFKRFNAAHSPSSSGNGYAIYASAGLAGSVNVIIDSNTFDVGQIYAVAPVGTRNSGLTVINNTATAPGELTIGRTDGVTFTGNTNITSKVVAP